MTIARTRFIGKTLMCRAIDTKMDEHGRVRDRQCTHSTVTSVYNVPLCPEHRKDTEHLLVADDDGNIFPFEAFIPIGETHG